jgi:hypothetical protein
VVADTDMLVVVLGPAALAAITAHRTAPSS